MFLKNNFSTCFIEFALLCFDARIGRYLVSFESKFEKLVPSVMFDNRDLHGTEQVSW